MIIKVSAKSLKQFGDSMNLPERRNDPDNRSGSRSGKAPSRARNAPSRRPSI